MVLEILFVLFPIAFIFLLVLLFSSLVILTEWERGVVLTLGRFSGVKNPGINFIVPFLQRIIKVDMRINTIDIPRQEVITKDNITLLINAVVYFRVESPADSVIKISDFRYALRQYTQGALRDVIGNSEMDHFLSEKDKVSSEIKKIVDLETSEWGLDITGVKIQEIELPAEMKRAMAKQAEAERERRASIIISEGELAAAGNLRKASEILSGSPGALHLRTLRTIKEISADPSEKIVLFLPSDTGEILKNILGKNK